MLHMKTSQVAAVLILGLMCISLLAQDESENTKVGSETPSTAIYTVGGGVSAPRAIKTPDPQYTKEAQKDRIQGKVVLWVTITPEGLPKNIKVRRSLGHGLDEEAIKAVKQWKFKPSTLNGQPVAVQINVEVTFRLE